MLDFRIDTFLMICRTMNFTHAAQLLHITQPAVSHQMQQLEEEYGVKLFMSQGKKLTLTAAGNALKATAVTMKHDDLLLKQQLQQIGSGAQQLTFGATLTAGPFALSHPLAHFLKSSPQTNVRMVIADTAALLKQIEEGKIDFAIVEGFFPEKDYAFLTYTQEKFVAVCAPNYLFHRPVASIEDLLEERLLVREEGSGTRSILKTYLHSHNLTFDDFPHWAEVNSIYVLKQLACAGCGITFLYETAVHEELAAGTLQEIPLQDFSLTHNFSFIWCKNSAFATHYREIFNKFCAFRD
jgi:DNA-binding transcriptional LysR family regulator